MRIWMLTQEEMEVSLLGDTKKYTTVMLFSSKKKAVKHLDYRVKALVEREYEIVIDHSKHVYDKHEVGYVYLSNRAKGITFDLTINSKKVW